MANYLAGMNEIYATILVTILAILVVYFLTRYRKKPINVILLVGLSGSGKTALFTKLIFNKQKKSVPSMRENEAHNKDLNLRIIDIPGSERLRDVYWEQFRLQARHVIFVIDSIDFDNKIRDISEYLYRILSDPNLHNYKIRLTLACSKQDLPDAKSRSHIGQKLEQELEEIRKTSKGQLGKTSNEEQEDYVARNFSDEKPLKLGSLGVEVIEASMHNLENLMRLIL